MLNDFPRALQPRAKAALHEIWMAETRADAERVFDRLLGTFGAKYPKAVECLAKHRAELLAFYDFPAEHWIHLRTTNPMESTFATVRRRTDRTKDRLAREGMLPIIFEPGMNAERSWRRPRGFEWLAKLIEGAKFQDGVEVRTNTRGQGQANRAAP